MLQAYLIHLFICRKNSILSILADMIVNESKNKHFFYVNKKARADGTHVIHTRDCWVMPNGSVYVGRYFSFEEAIKEASQQFTKLAVCPYCQKAH